MRPDERIGSDDAAKFAVTGAACRSVGWDFVRVGTPDGVLMANVRWLAGYRHPRVHRPEVAARLVEVFVEGGGLLAGARRVGDQIAVLPVLFHLLWRRALAGCWPICCPPVVSRWSHPPRCGWPCRRPGCWRGFRPRRWSGPSGGSGTWVIPA
ncbi:TnsA-like heteromeric transposase endonuclease subunit [Streptomyces sp. ME18-1-4]|uniref:TnsA-like heteromeric transposase endonuclease subunit n=1 Tax=Streptomyces sp. ME18-1-4 TaxID=3028685 RepID=UPI0029C9C8BB|nr:TnsA-like heteromeric transposase endonuclease subunit [Streptomyces sp. ME18-1-4]